ncbi:hypothetical protein RJ492_001188 [Pluralibacter gergoviae]|uniref:Uncharacterized protein n=1 Tax=Pluralibacter gergoviae TaxID=61647 RepID=A0AAI9GLT7_PLUGE|nr:hypothetical protein [Pluralibacter gergoviae]EKV9907729.1 hypothetical protein [Pluralibacter gergoviae]EKW7276802.1 hypothetical protein [Pluralibacter gergoviae]ELD4293939.1 hypothetical protein [Pluralibacter gergoviae]ELD4304718.1 hypothetical protein [Pluralibacter gergoviae]
MDKMDPGNKRFNVIFPVVCALLGAFITAAFGWYGNYLQASATSRSSCIARIDKQEEILREKYSKLMVSIVGFSFSPKLAGSLDEGTLRELIIPVVSNSAEVIAYAPPEMALAATKVMKALFLADISKNNIELQEEAITQAKDSMAGAYPAYLKALKALDIQRKKCD